MPLKRRVFVVGVGMTKFSKPQKEVADGPHYPELAKIAVTRALQDAALPPSAIEQCAVGNMFAGGGAGQRALYEMGIFDIPIYNVSNACATGSNALLLCRQFIEGGLNECCLALGVEKMRPGSLGGGAMDGSPTPLDLHMPVMFNKYEGAADAVHVRERGPRAHGEVCARHHDACLALQSLHPCPPCPCCPAVVLSCCRCPP